MNPAIPAFIVGLHLGRFTNFVSNTIVTGVILYFVQPDIYSYDTLINMKNMTTSLIQSLH